MLKALSADLYAKDGKLVSSKFRKKVIFEPLKVVSLPTLVTNICQFDFRYNDLLQILIKMKPLLRTGITIATRFIDYWSQPITVNREFSAEPHLARVAPPAVIVGDIHGQVYGSFSIPRIPYLIVSGTIHFFASVPKERRRLYSSLIRSLAFSFFTTHQFERCFWAMYPRTLSVSRY